MSGSEERGRDRPSDAQRYRRLLRFFFPKELVRRQGEEMEATFLRLLDLERRRRGRRGEVAAWLNAVLDGIRNGWVRRGAGSLRWPGGAGISLLDVKLGLRMLTKHPGLTSVAMLALVIGIPVGLAPAHLVSAFEAPLPVDEGDRIQVLRYWNMATSRPAPTTMYDFMQWREELAGVEALGATRRRNYNFVSEDGLTAPVRGADVTASTFDILRVPPLLGRTLNSADEVVGAPDVAVIGYDLWQSRLGGDPDVVGQTIRIGRLPRTIVGVMPEEFLFPINHQLWLPLRERLADDPRAGRPLTIFGRLSDEVSPETLQAELSAAVYQVAIEFPDAYEQLRPEVVPFVYLVFNGPSGGMRAGLEYRVIQLLALALLVVACANVGLLMFARTATRSTELAMRTALGAGRLRIISQMFTESLVLAVLAAGVGIFVADRIYSFLHNLAAGLGGLPYWMDLGVTRTTVSWALSLAVLSAAVAGIVPALKVTGKAVQRSIQSATAGRTGIRFGGMSTALVVADVAIAVAVVGFATGVADTVWKAAEADDAVGIQADQFLSAEFRLPAMEPAADATARLEFTTRVGAAQRALVERLRAEPGIRDVAVASVLPRMDHPARMIEVDVESSSDDFQAFQVRTARVTLDFFDALDQPILAGRAFDTNDLGANGSAVIVNTTFADRVLDGRNPIGRRIRYRVAEGVEPGPWYEIVGMVGQLGMHVLDPDGDEGLYHPLAPGEVNAVRLAIHVGDDPESFTPRLRVLANEVDPTAVVAGPQALSQVYEGDWYIGVATTFGGAVFIGILLALAASGIYAMMSFAVAERTKEIGVRTALGAQRSSIAFSVAKRALLQLGLGVLIGMPIAGRLFFMVREGAGSTYSAFAVGLVPGVGVMVLIGLFACGAPTLRALRIMPTEALR